MASDEPSVVGNGRRAYFTPTISLGNILVIISMLAGAVLTAFTAGSTIGGIRGDIAVLQSQMGIVMTQLGIADAERRPRLTGERPR